MGGLWSFYSTETPLQILFVTGLIGGGAAALAGRAIAETWRRFRAGGRLYGCCSPPGSASCISPCSRGTLCRCRLISLTSFGSLWSAASPGAISRTSQMVEQYPWLYERTGPLSLARQAYQRVNRAVLPPQVRGDFRPKARQMPLKVAVRRTLPAADVCRRGDQMKKSLFAGLALGLAIAAPAFAQDITVGVAGPMTGGEATFGRQMKNGAEQAVADINAAGGVLGKKLKLEVGDDACDPKQARSVGEKFAGMKLPFVAGHYCSSSSIPASEAYAEGGVLQITPASTNPTFTERKLWNTFRVCGRDDQQGAVAGAVHRQELQGQERRDHPRQDHLRQRPRRRDQEGAQQGRHEGQALREPTTRATRTSPRSSPSSSATTSISSMSAATTRKPA